MTQWFHIWEYVIKKPKPKTLIQKIISIPMFAAAFFYNSYAMGAHQ